MRLFASGNMIKIMERLGMEEGMEISHPMLNRSIESAQKKVEQHHFQMRKRTLEYDDVLNKQREEIYGFRTDVLKGIDTRDQLLDIMEEVVIAKVQELTEAETPVDEWNVRPLADWVNINFPIALSEEDIIKVASEGEETPLKDSAFGDLNRHQFALCLHIAEEVRKAYELKISFEEEDAIKSIERYTLLSAIDKLWQEHLYNMDSLRTSISLRAIGQKDPLIEYKTEAFYMFGELLDNIKTEVCHNIFRSASSLQAFEQFLMKLPKRATHAVTNTLAEAESQQNTSQKASAMITEASDAVEKIKTRPQPVKTGPKVGRNDPCPCGSGKKYKQCCGKQ
jgi:preprotein translocase subunit SecA